MLSRLKFKLTDLANEILDQFPKSVFESSTTTFCDPCIGGGQLIAAVEARLRAYGHSDANIASRVFGFEENPLRLRFAKHKYNLVAQLNIYKLDESEINMKFDVTLTNPPYQNNGGDSAQKLWKRFIVSAYNITNTNGTVAIICPATWTKPITDNASRINREVNATIFGNTLVGSDLNCSAHFPNVGVHITYFISRKDGVEQEQKYKFIGSEVCNSILNKIVQKEGSAIVLDRADGTVWSQSSIKRKDRCETYNIPVLDGDKVLWTDVDDLEKRKSPKVIIKRGFGYMPKRDEGKYAYPQSSENYVPRGDETLDGAWSFFNSKIIRFTMKNGWTPQTNYVLLKMVPKPDLSKVWTDNELYAHFGLTQEEIDYVEANG